MEKFWGTGVSKLDRAKIQGMSGHEIAQLRKNAAANVSQVGAVEILGWCDDELASRKSKVGRSDRSKPKNVRRGTAILEGLPNGVDALAGEIWSYINCGIAFPWPKSAKARGNLSDSIGWIIDGDAKGVSVPRNLREITENEEFNIKLREVVFPHLLKRSDDKSDLIAAWIVKDWGGIRSGSGDSFSRWIAQIREHGVDAFIDQMGIDRISSWSKILAFSDPENHAIYDARTAVALNCALSSLDINDRFYMPMSQNRTIAAARDLLVLDGEQHYLGYRAYVALLKQIAARCGISSVLKVEMALFANAPTIAKNFR